MKRSTRGPSRLRRTAIEPPAAVRRLSNRLRDTFGRRDTTAVKTLALSLERIFTAQGIQREALGALRLFCQAARRDAATLEMARKAKAELERRGA